MDQSNESRARLQTLNEKALLGGGTERIKKQHAQGKHTARERVDHLVDPGSFQEFDKFVTHQAQSFGLANDKILGDGVITGVGKINGRQVALFSQDFTA